jgi:hypothetical protein
MCLVRIRPEREEEVIIANRVARRPRRTVIEETRVSTSPSRVRVPTPPPPPRVEVAIVEQHHHRRHSSSSSSSPSRHSREAEYYRETRREYSPSRQDAYRYVEPPRRSSGERYVMEQGSITYSVSPRHSSASHRSGRERERVVISDNYGRRREYYR